METYAEMPGGYKETHQEIIEIKLWEVYLRYARSPLYQMLAAYALDNGAVEKDHQDDGRISFRFLAFDWERSVRRLLYENRIPVIVKSNPLAAMRMRRGGQAEMEAPAKG